MVEHTIGQVEEFGGGGDVGRDGHVALLGFSHLEEFPSQWVRVVGGASAVCRLRLGRHGGWRGWRGARVVDVGARGGYSRAIRVQYQSVIHVPTEKMPQLTRVQAVRKSEALSTSLPRRNFFWRATVGHQPQSLDLRGFEDSRFTRTWGISTFQLRIQSYRIGLVRDQIPSNTKHSQTPQSTLRQPEETTEHTTLTLRFARVHIAVHEKRASDNPEGTNAGREFGILQASDQGEEHRLRGILEEIGVGALGAVELLGLGLRGGQQRNSGSIEGCNLEHTFSLHCSMVA